MDPMKEFTKWVITQAVFNGSSIDGGEIQDKATELGLLTVEKYDPEQHTGIEDLEPGEDIYVYSDLLK